MSYMEGLEVLMVYLGFFGIITILGLALIVIIQIIGVKLFKFNIYKWLYKKAINS